MKKLKDGDDGKSEKDKKSNANDDSEMGDGESENIKL